MDILTGLIIFMMMFGAFVIAPAIVIPIVITTSINRNRNR